MSEIDDGKGPPRKRGKWVSIYEVERRKVRDVLLSIPEGDFTTVATYEDMDKAAGLDVRKHRSAVLHPVLARLRKDEGQMFICVRGQGFKRATQEERQEWRDHKVSVGARAIQQAVEDGLVCGEIADPELALQRDVTVSQAGAALALFRPKAREVLTKAVQAQGQLPHRKVLGLFQK